MAPAPRPPRSRGLRQRDPGCRSPAHQGAWRCRARISRGPVRGPQDGRAGPRRDGPAIRSQPLRLPEPVVEEGVSADYDGDGALVMTLRKQATTQDAGRMGDPETAA